MVSSYRWREERFTKINISLDRGMEYPTITVSEFSSFHISKNKKIYILTIVYTCCKLSTKSNLENSHLMFYTWRWYVYYPITDSVVFYLWWTILDQCTSWKQKHLSSSHILFRYKTLTKERQSSKLVNILILKTILFIPQNMFQSIHTSSSFAKNIIKTVNILNLHVS